ncbi:retrovirus-related Pol polyprotein from type-1 retrotransposable element R2, partial [Clonorchis sinensis]
LMNVGWALNVMVQEIPGTEIRQLMFQDDCVPLAYIHDEMQPENPPLRSSTVTCINSPRRTHLIERLVPEVVLFNQNWKEVREPLCKILLPRRCARHNRVARELAKRLRRLGYTVFEELRAPTSTSFIKPDLIAVRERRATVIDVSIVSDGRGVTVWNEKKQKYGADEFSLAIISALCAIGCDVDFLVHQPMIISYRGICFPQSAKAVIGLGLSKVTVSDLCLLAIVGSLRTYDTFMRGTWR